MRPVITHRLLALFITGIATAATDGSSMFERKEIKYASITPFRGALCGLYLDYNILRSMYQRSFDSYVEMTGTSKLHSSATLSTKCANMAHWVVANIFLREDPALFICEFFGHGRLAEWHMLSLIFDKLSQQELETAYRDLVPVMAMSRAEIARFQAKVRSETPRIKRDLKLVLDFMGAQSPADFIAQHHPDRTPKDIIAYISLRCQRNAGSLRDELSAVLDAVYARMKALRSGTNSSLTNGEGMSLNRVFDIQEETVLTKLIYRLLGFQLENDKRGTAAITPAFKCMASQYSRTFIELLSSPLIENRIKGAVINYACISNAEDADPHFARGYLEAQRRNGMITEKQEVFLLCSYYRNCDDAQRARLLAVDDKFPEPLPYEFRQRVCNTLYEEACREDSGIDAVMQAKYNSNPDRNDRSQHMAKIDAYLEYYRPTIQAAAAEQGVVSSPSMAMDESP
ncbi:hypothetical protein PAPHI01_0323 [Pancytospora philotis]|nr:hypothetical protein PAPHI01_0323 [Pancytospora philotis]